MNAPSRLPSPQISDAERFQLFVAAVADYAIYMLSPEGYINSWNVGAQRFNGYTPGEIIGQHFSRFYTEEDRAAGMPKKALHIAATEGKFEDEGWRMRKDGTRFWASVVIDPIRDGAGQLIGFTKVTRDITQQKQAQEALRASEERFRLLVQGVTDYAIYMLSPEGEITNWNAGAERITGYTENEVIGTHFSRFHIEEDRAKGLPMESLKIAIREGRFEREGLRVRKDGATFWAHVVIDPIHNHAGELIGFAKVTRDITERQEARAALERAQEALFQSQKLEALGKLTGGVAHDFNNLLATILNGIELLTREVRSPSAVKVLGSMQRAAESGATLTRQLLMFARKQPLSQERHNLSRLVTSFEAVLRRSCNESIRFELQCDPDLAPVMVDGAQFEAALLNLVANARDAMPDGGTLTIVTENVDPGPRRGANLPPGRLVRLSVRDNGHGMPPDVASRAIEPFFTTKEPGKGSGMGLSQVYGFTQQSGGELKIESVVGKGTVVSMYLPPVADENVAEVKSDSGNEKALIVDDQPDVLDMTVELFRSMGYEVLSANNGEDALEVLKRTPDIDVLFTDVRMPGVSGIELGAEARRMIPGIQVILASGFASDTLAADHAGLERFDFLNKPYRLAELIKVLRKASR
jgi:PAS domain S-box-containing protein